MIVRVRFFARAADLAGGELHSVEVPANATIAELRNRLAEAFAELESLCPNLMMAVGTDYVAETYRLTENAEVVCFPPVSGG